MKRRVECGRHSVSYESRGSLFFMQPCYEWWEVPYYWAGLKAYDLVANFGNLAMSAYLTPSESLRKFPTLSETRADGATLKGTVCTSQPHDVLFCGSGILICSVLIVPLAVWFQQLIDLIDLCDTTRRSLVQWRDGCRLSTMMDSLTIHAML